MHARLNTSTYNLYKKTKWQKFVLNVAPNSISLIHCCIESNFYCSGCATRTYSGLQEKDLIRCIRHDQRSKSDFRVAKFDMAIHAITRFVCHKIRSESA